jgi:hypothetical protein
MIGPAAGIAVVIALIALTFHYFKWWPRLVSGLLCAAAAAGLLAVAELIGSVWTFTEHGAGLVLLIGLLAVSAIMFYVMVIRGHRHHPIASGAVAILFGMTAVLTVGGWRHVLAGSGAGLKSAGAAFGAIGSGNGAAISSAAATGHASDGGTFALVAFAALLGVLVLVFVRVHRKGARRAGGSPARRGIEG